MFTAGQVFKVKIELSPELIGFGRATIVETDGKKIYIKIRSSKGERSAFPSGTRLWFVGNSVDNKFNGLWASEVLISKTVDGEQVLECKAPKFQPQVQQRRHRRAIYRATVKVQQDGKVVASGVSRNISRSGMGISLPGEQAADYTAGQSIELVLETPGRVIPLQAKVITSGYNWLLHRTDVGLEFENLAPDTVTDLDHVLVWLGSQPRHDTGEMKQTGGLSKWLRTTKENRKMIGKEQSAVDVSEDSLPEEEVDLEEDIFESDDEPPQAFVVDRSSIEPVTREHKEQI